MQSTSYVRWLGLCVVLAGCSGSAGTTPQNEGGAGGGGGASTGNGGHGAGSTECPSDMPAEGTHCSISENVPCVYGDCCPTFAWCKAGHFVVEPADCTPVACPSEVPEDGASCKCSAGLECVWDRCDELGTTVTGSCSEDVWTVDAAPCKGVVCGETTCGADELCVRSVTLSSETFECQPNPCGGPPYDCSCAKPACPSSYTCTDVWARTVTCECLACL